MAPSAPHPPPVQWEENMCPQLGIRPRHQHYGTHVWHVEDMQQDPS